jgi:molybdopterin biosynthesis enzyme
MAPGKRAGAAPPMADESLSSVEEVAASIAVAIAVVPAATLPLPQAAGRVLAEPVRAPFPLPRFDNAAMDGYAVRTPMWPAPTRTLPQRCGWSRPHRRARPRRRSCRTELLHPGQQVLRRHGDLRAWRVALRPAKPFVFGVVHGTVVFGLPGNPVAALAAYEVFVRPALLAMQGRGGDRPRQQAQLTEPFSQPPGRLHLVRGHCWCGVTAVWSGPWAPRGRHGACPGRRERRMVVPPEVEHLPAGSLVEVWPM